MKRPSLWIATTEPQGSIEMSEAIEGLMNECKAAQPTVVLLVWETTEGDEFATSIRSIPDSNALRRGLVDTVFKILFPVEENIAGD
jgi:hypothetical protein